MLHRYWTNCQYIKNIEKIAKETIIRKTQKGETVKWVDKHNPKTE